MEIKKVNLNNLNDEELLKHKENVLKMTEDEIVEYLEYVLDDSADEFTIDNNCEIINAESIVMKFMTFVEFKPYFKNMYDKNVEMIEKEQKEWENKI